MASSATSASTICRIVSDVDAFADVDISTANNTAVRALLKRVSGVRSWAAATESLLLNRAEELAKPVAPSGPPSPKPAGSDAPNSDSGLGSELGSGRGSETPSGDNPAVAPAAASEPEPRGPSPQDLLTLEGKASNAQAHVLRERAELLKVLVAFREALTRNRISGDHIDAIVTLLARITLVERNEFVQLAIAADLHEVAARESVETFTRTIRGLLQALRKEDHDEKLKRQMAQTFLSMWTNRDGMLVINGEFDPESGNLVRNYFDNFVRSLFTAHQDKQLVIPDGVANKTKWLRAQALIHSILGRSGADLCNLNGRPGNTEPETTETADAAPPDKLATASGSRSSASNGTGNVRPPVSATAMLLFADADKLANRIAEATGDAVGHFANGTPIGARTLRRLACDSLVMPMIFGSNSIPLDAGDNTRTANRQQRRALEKMYGGCMFCTTPFNWCQIHHFWHWADHGPSDLWNLGPLCPHHHHRVHDTGYTIHQNPNSTLSLRAADGTIIATTTVAHPRPPPDTKVRGSSYTSAFINGTNNQNRSRAAGKKPKPSTKPAAPKPVRPETIPWTGDETTKRVIIQPTRGPNPALF